MNNKNHFSSFLKKIMEIIREMIAAARRWTPS
jgi:hypothetical protein